MSDENTRKSGVVMTVAKYFANPAAEQLANEIGDLWSIATGQNNVKLTEAVLKVESKNIALQRNIRDLEYKIIDVLQENDCQPELISSTYFFEDKGPYCTTCYDTSKKKVVLTEKLVDYRKIQVISEIVFILLMLFTSITLFYSFSKNILNESTIIFFIPVAIVTVFLIYNFFRSSFLERIIEKFIIRKIERLETSPIKYLKCGSCNNRLSIEKRTIEKYLLDYMDKKEIKDFEILNEELIEIDQKTIKRFEDLSKEIEKKLSANQELNDYYEKVDSLKDIINSVSNFNDYINQVNKLLNDRETMIKNLTPN